MGDYSLPPINEIVGTLGRVADGKALLAKAQKDFPALKDIFEAGEVADADSDAALKKGSSGDEENDKKYRRAVLGQLAGLALEAIRLRAAECDVVLADIKKRLAKASSFRLGGQVIATVSSGSVLGTIPVGAPILTGLTGASALIGSLVAIGAERFSQTRLKGTPLKDLHPKCITLSENARTLGVELENAKKRANSISMDLLEDVVARGNALCAELAAFLGEQ